MNGDGHVWNDARRNNDRPDDVGHGVHHGIGGRGAGTGCSRPWEIHRLPLTNKPITEPWRAALVGFIHQRNHVDERFSTRPEIVDPHAVDTLLYPDLRVGMIV